MSGRLAGASLWLLATVLLAALTHFIAILLLPRVATRDAYDRLATIAGASDRMTILPATAPGSAILPFQDPAAVQGICFFDLTQAPVRLKALVDPGRFLSLSFRTREGQIFYAMTDRAALHDAIDIRLVTEAQLQAVEAGDDEDQGLPTELRLKAPASRGVIVVTALVARPGERQDAEAEIKAVTCRPEAITAAQR